MRPHNPNRAPYMPPPAKRGARYSRDYRRQIIYTLQYRGDYDDIPTIIIIGAPLQLVIDTFTALQRLTSAFVCDYILSREHNCRFSFDKHYWRTAVEIHGLTDGCLTIDDILILFEKKIQDLCWCRSVRRMSLQSFLNQ